MRLPIALFLAAGSALTLAPSAHAQVSLTTTTYSQNFDSLATSGTTNANTTLPTGWSFLEGGTNANTTYAASTGSETGGNTYSFGASGNSDRALGVQQSGSLTSIIGFKFTNNTGSTITSLDVAYVGEQWRRAAAADTLAFSYQLADVALNAGSTWTSVSALNFVTSVTGTGTNLDGNATANRASLSSSLTSLNIANGSTVTFRWVDASGSSSAGMGIDNFSLTATLYSPPPVVGTGLFWAGTSGSGGAGTWTSSSTTFATDATFATTNLGIGSGTVVFAGATAGTVTIDGGVSVASGLRFSTTGYSLAASTLDLAGANAAANTITVDADVTATIGTQVTGAAGLTKAGAGSLVLTGANSYTGGTVVSAGRLTATAASLSGNVANSGNVTFNQSTDATYSGAITGTGSLTKEGAGNLTLSGANAHTGGTTVSAGTLTVSTSSISGAIANNAALAFSQSTDAAFAGAITGTGSLSKSGAGNLTLAGANSYSGGTTVSQGTLTVSTVTLPGSVTNNAALVFNQAAAGTYAGAITGTGTLTKSGAGNLTLTGANAHTGGTTVSAGTLTVSSASISGAIVNNAALVFNQADAGTYAGALSGTGTLTKSGAGALTLSGDSSGFSGATSLRAGTTTATYGNALGSGAVTVDGGALSLAAGVTLANALTVGFGSSLTPNVLIAGWDFQTTANGGTQILAAPNTPKVLVANFGAGTLYLDGTNGSSSWVSSTVSADKQLDAFGGTNSVNAGDGFSTTTGAGSLSLVNQSANGKSIVMAINMAGHAGLSVSYAAQRTASGFANHTWEYSLDGSTWSPYQVASSLATSFATVSLDQLSALNGDATAWLRLTVSGASSETGNNRIDNLQVRGSAVGPAGGSGTLGLAEAGSATFSGNVTIHGAATLTAVAGATATFSGILSGGGSVAKTGAGTVVLGSANTFEGGVTVSAGTLLIGDVGALGTGAVTVSGGVLDLANLAPTNVIVVSGGSLLNASAWAALGAIQLSGNVDSSVINNLGADITEVTVAAGATVNLSGVNKDIVFEGGTLNNLAAFTGNLKVRGTLDVSAGYNANTEIEVGAGGTLNFGSLQSSRTVKYTGGAIQGAGFTGTVDVEGSVSLSSAIGAGNVRLGNGASATIQAGFDRDLRLESGATLSGLNNYSGELTVAADTFSTTGITTAATLAVESGSTLKGSGTIGGLTQVAGSILAPGNSPGMLTVTGTHALAGGASMEVEFLNPAGAAGVGYDAVTAGTLDLSGLSTANRYILNLVSLVSVSPDAQGALAGFDASATYLFDLLDYATLTLPQSYAGSISDLFVINVASFTPQVGLVSSGSFQVVNNVTTGMLQLEYSPIPEPSTYGLLLGGLALAASALRRRRKQSA